MRFQNPFSGLFVYFENYEARLMGLNLIAANDGECAHFCGSRTFNLQKVQVNLTSSLSPSLICCEVTSNCLKKQ